MPSEPACSAISVGFQIRQKPCGVRPDGSKRSSRSFMTTCSGKIVVFARSYAFL
jgi:hypothetical protein